MSTPKVAPWQKAESFVHAHLYWLPVRAFPHPREQREWIFQFVQKLSAIAKETLSLEPEFLLRASTINDHLVEAFSVGGREHVPLIGLCRNTGETVRKAPTLEELKPVQTGEKAFRMGDYAPDYCYWLAARKLPEALRAFSGFGGAAVVFHPPDPGSAPPKMPRIMAFNGDPHLGPEQIAANMNILFALKSAFLKKSKTVFGRGIEDHPQFRDLLFVVPRWNAQLYVGSRPETVAEWFSVFPIQFVESVEDGGLLLASAASLDSVIEQISGELASQELVYHA